MRCVERLNLTVGGGEQRCCVEDKGMDWSGGTAVDGGRHLGARLFLLGAAVSRRSGGSGCACVIGTVE